jgi:hypothetical protein
VDLPDVVEDVAELEVEREESELKERELPRLSSNLTDTLVFSLPRSVLLFLIYVRE